MTESAADDPVQTPHCLVEQDGHKLVVTLNRPEARIALSGAIAPTNWRPPRMKTRPIPPITATASFQQRRTAATAISLEPAPRYWPTRAAAAVAIANPGRKDIDSTRMARMCAPSAPSSFRLEITRMP